MRTPRTLLTQTLGVLVILLLSLARSPAAQPTMVNLTIHVVGEGTPPLTGAVGVIPIGQVCNNVGATLDCTFQVAQGTNLRLAANSPSTPGVFSNPTGSATCGPYSTCSFTINADSGVTATFDQATPIYTMTINLAGDAGGEVSADNNRCQNYDSYPAHALPAQFNACTSNYAQGSVVTLEARPPAGTRFSGFSNGTSNAAVCNSTGTPCSFVLDNNDSVTATFSAMQSLAVEPRIPAPTVNINGSLSFTAQGTFTDGFTGAIHGDLGTWTTKASMPTPRFDLAAAVAGGQIYAMGGIAPSSCGPSQPPPCGGPSDIVEAYNPLANAWTARAAMSTPRAGLGVGTIDGKIYAVGGQTSGSVPGSFIASLDVYDPAFNMWTPLDPMPGGPRGFMAAAVVNGKLYAIGGQDATGVLGRVEEYDPNAIPATWTLKASMPTPRRFLAVGVVNDSIYAVGGDNAGASPSTIEGTKVEAYDPFSNTWTTKASLPDGGRTILAVAAIDNVLYALGGQSQFLRSSVFAYDTVADSWSNKAFIPTVQTEFGPPSTSVGGARGESAAVALDGRVYLMGGYAVVASGEPPLPILMAFTDNLIWSTSNSTVATIGQFGQATGKSPGTTTVTARTGPLTCGTQCAELTVTNVIANSPPTVTIFGNPPGAPAVTISAGGSISTNGSFRDPDSGQTWTATVSYGDGSGIQPLALGIGSPPLGPTGTFSLSHTYANAGNYTATVTVRDSAGGAASATLRVTVNGVQNPQIFLGLPGTAFTNVNNPSWGCGSFLDQNASGGSWSATVNYGDGSGTQSLPLTIPPPASSPCVGSGGTPPTGVFAFNHSYSTGGSFSASVTITNTVTHATKTGGFTVNVTDNTCATLTFTVSGNVPFQSIPITVTFGGQSFEKVLNVGANTLDFRTRDQGTYHVQFHPPAGYEVIPAQLDFTVVCGSNLTLSAQVALLDSTPPAVTNTSITVEATGPLTAVIIPVPTATDLVDGPVPVICAPPAGFPVGITTVNCTATDAHGNIGHGTVTVTVRDTTAPLAACTAFALKLDKGDDDDDDRASLAKGLFKVTGSDLVGPLKLTIGSYSLVNGDVIKLSVTHQAGVIEITKTKKSGIRRFLVGSANAFILAQDGAGNTTKASCPLGRPDDDDDKDKKDEDDRTKTKDEKEKKGG